MFKNFKYEMKTAIIGVIPVLLISSSLMGQTEDGLHFILKNNPIDKEQINENYHISLNQTCPFKLFFMGTFRIAQTYILSQDKGVCHFTVSCSDFTVKAVSKYGVFHGLLMSSDRIQRCHAFAKKYYPRDLNKGLAIDYPIHNYYIGKSREEGEKEI